MSQLDRRQFLRRAAMIGAAAAGASAFATACTSKDGGGDSLSCENPTGLDQAARDMRESQAYTDESPEEGKDCANCQFYVEPDAAGSCGSCTVLMNSPVHPDGYCNLWAEKAA